MIESAARRLAHELVNRREAINRELSRNGVRFGIYKNGEYHDRLFPYDPVPRIIESDEYDELEKGLKQRVNALNAYLKDIYSDKRIIHDGVVPEEYVYTSADYFPQVNGVTEQLKAENQMEWVRQMNACKAQAEEVVKAELIYD